MRSLDEIKKEFCRLRSIYRQMVGTLYSGIAYCYLCELRDEYERAGGIIQHLPYILPPRADGSVQYMSEEPA